MVDDLVALLVPRLANRAATRLCNLATLVAGPASLLTSSSLRALAFLVGDAARFRHGPNDLFSAT
jgi:hypothetical protein